MVGFKQQLKTFLTHLLYTYHGLIRNVNETIWFNIGLMTNAFFYLTIYNISLVTNYFFLD